MNLEQYVTKLVKDWAATSDGKRAIKQKFDVKYDPDFSNADVVAYAEKMREILLRWIQTKVPSFTKEDIVIETPEQTKRGICVKLSFVKNKLKRESLFVDEYDGVDDIVLLMTKGYHARDYVYGQWYRPNMTWYGAGDFINVRSRKDRDPDNFMSEAVQEFNAQAKGDVVAILNREYKNE